MEIIGMLEALILFVAVLLMALADSAGTGILNNFDAITVLTLMATVGLTIWHTYKYRKNGVNTIVAFVFTLISEVAGALYILLCVRDVAIVAATGGFILNLLGVILSMPLAIITIAVVKFPNVLATAAERETGLVVFDGIGTLVLVLIFCSVFDFHLHYLF